MSGSASNRPQDLTEFRSLFAPVDHDLAPEHFACLRRRIRCLAQEVLPPNDDLRREIDSEDLAQDVLLHLVQHVDEFRGSTWPEFFAFVRTMTHQRRLDRARRQNRQKRQRDPEAQTHRATEPKSPSVIAMGREEKRRLRLLIEDLPQSLKAVLELRLQGKGYAEIADEIGFSEANTRQRVSRSIKTLRERWGGMAIEQRVSSRARPSWGPRTNKSARPVDARRVACLLE